MRTPGLSVFAVFVAILVFPFAARALITVGALDIPGVTESVVVVDGVAYVVGGSFSDPGSGLRVIDVSDPTAPVEMGAVLTPGQAKRVVVVDGLAYIAESPLNFGPISLRVIDVSDPAAPVEVGAIDVQHGICVVLAIPVGAVCTANSDCTASCSPSSSNRGAFCTADSDCPGGTCSPGDCLFPNFVEDLAVDGGFAYIADFTLTQRGIPGGASLHIFDVSNPAAPVAFDPIDVPTGNVTVEVVDGLAYVGGSTGGNLVDLRIFDVSNPAAPVELSATGGEAFRVEVVGGLAYIMNFFELRVVDISNPAAPVEISSIDIEPNFGLPNFAVEDGNPYLAYPSSGLRLIDVSNPAAPVGFDGALDPTTGANDVAIAGGLAYVVGNAGLAVVDDIGQPARDRDISSRAQRVQP